MNELICFLRNTKTDRVSTSFFFPYVRVCIMSGFQTLSFVLINNVCLISEWVKYSLYLNLDCELSALCIFLLFIK